MRNLATQHSIQIVYNGNDFRSIEKSRIPDDEKVATLGMAADIDAVLQPLRPDIEKEGGTVTIDVRGPTMFHIDIRNLSEKLADRVHKALTPPNA